MSVRRQQSGFALLLMVFVLLGLGMTGMSRVSGLHRVSGSGFTTDQYALQAARQSLLSYAALYPFHYGARGAGPGHLPCPDTDTVTTAPREPSSGKDGPNPPCGSGAVASGQLPRHVNLGTHRYVFHVEPFQRLEYSVSSGVINNPVNRIVNDEILLGRPAESPFLAWIRQPPIEQGQSRQALQEIAITRQSLLPGVKRAVSAWFVWQVEHHTAEKCLSPPAGHSNAERPQSTNIVMLVATREPAALSQPLPERVGEVPGPCHESSMAGLSEQGWQLEGVPLASHWFVRNRWHERIVVTESEPCRGETIGVCSLMPDENKPDAEPSDQRLHFTWRVI